CRGTLWQMAKAYLTLMLLTFGELAVGLWLLRVPGALTLAALIALVDILPVLGVGTVLLPWGAVAFVNGDTTLGAWLLLLYALITVVRNLLEPRLVAHRVGLPPVVALLCLYLGWQVAGVAGILLLPLAATLLWQLQMRGYVKLWK
ncbi:MAG: AI-2E family transporter, partial [Clostridia bacterium]|nr:AI-2E family transporter [Clostridia bacterium]